MEQIRKRTRTRRRRVPTRRRVRILRDLQEAPAGTVATVVKDLGVMDLMLVELDGTTLLVKEGREVGPMDGSTSDAPDERRNGGH